VGAFRSGLFSLELVTVAAGTGGKTAMNYVRYEADGRLAVGSDQDAARGEAILAERASFMP
jgi:hypothetical protein